MAHGLGLRQAGRKTEMRRSKSKVPIAYSTGQIRPKVYTILEEKIFEGCLGAVWNEDLSTPSDQGEAEVKADKISQRVMNSICEYFDFGDYD